VSPASRRIFLYWLLLLVPTLVVGGVAIQLLRREQARIAVQGAYALEARRAAVTARARLVVENVELLVGDVQAALLDTLATEPEADLDGFLEQWEKNNPLVRTAFLCSPNGQLLRPLPNAANEDARGFVRRFSSLLRDDPPWTSHGLKDESDTRVGEKKAQSSEPPARKEIASNVAQVQSARRDVQELAKARDYSSAAVSAPSRGSQPSGREADFASTDRQASGEKSVALAPAAAGMLGDRPAVDGVSNHADRAQKKQDVASPAKVAQKKREKVTVADRRGWITRTTDGHLHLIGWVQPGGEGNVRGVELELAALISRLGGALPVEIGADEGYALRDDQGRVVHQIGAVPRTGEIAVRVPLADSLLPGWDVAAYLSFESARSVNGTDFFWVSAMLVAIFVTAILSGGFLLLRQARRSELEAVQKTSFVANVSHEFKTPLTTIRLYSELLEQGRVRDAKQGGEYLRTIGRETERLARLVNNALDFSRLEQGQKKYARERLDLVFELTRLLETHSPRVAEAGLMLKCSMPSEPIFVTTDRDAVEQIILNLVDNACKYAASGGEVIVSAASVSGGGAEVRVADRGPGVPLDQRERIFEKFHRVNDALTAEKTGAGLGLSIARQLARGLGGELQYEPRDGGGAEFLLKLP
jgi:two-component system phosphate regulon sensor histidine kinase PhoR